MPKNFTPLSDLVVVEKIDHEKKTTSGIIHSIQQIDRFPAKGVVVSKGSDVTEVDVGDTILYSSVVIDSCDCIEGKVVDVVLLHSIIGKFENENGKS